MTRRTFSMSFFSPDDDINDIDNDIDNDIFDDYDVINDISNASGTCDICGAPLDHEDRLIHLCKICQAIQFED